MVTIALQFLAGRFHATPWGRHVNEGVAEWPPSPWRLLRALVGTAKRTLTAVTDAELAELLAPFAALPEFWVPPAAPGHTRHWMPWFKKGPGDKTLVLDTFAAVAPDAALYVHWPSVNLSAEMERLLQKVLGNLTYFGRAESWCEAWLAERPAGERCLPVSEAVTLGQAGVSMLCALEAEPMALLRSLMVETSHMREVERQLTPQGSRWVQYVRPQPAWIDFPVAPVRAPTPERVNYVRFALDGNPLPRWTDALRVGEKARRAVLSRLAGKEKEELPPHRVGHDAEGPARLQHQHPFFLPEDRRGKGRVDHLLLWFPVGLTEDEMERLIKMRELHLGETVQSLLFLGGWSASTVQQEQLLVKADTIWESVTPFVFTRYPKTYKSGAPKLNERGEQVDGGEEQIRREWALRRSVRPDLPELIEVLPLATYEVGGRSIAWREFRRWRERGERPIPFFGGYRLNFASPVGVPVALGYGAHLGLGQFRPARSSESLTAEMRCLV